MSLPKTRERIRHLLHNRIAPVCAGMIIILGLPLWIFLLLNQIDLLRANLDGPGPAVFTALAIPASVIALLASVTAPARLRHRPAARKFFRRFVIPLIIPVAMIGISWFCGVREALWRINSSFDEIVITGWIVYPIVSAALYFFTRMLLRESER